MEFLNRLMEEPIYDIYGTNTREGYFKIKNERFNIILNESQKIKEILKTLKIELQELHSEIQ